MQRHTPHVWMATGKKSIFCLFYDINTMKCEQRVWGEIKHTYPYFSFWTTSPYGRKIHFSRENCVRGTKSGARKLATFASCSNPASSILIVEGSVYTRNILSFIAAEDIDQIKLDFTYRGLKHTGGSIRWIQPTSELTFCRCTRLRSRFAENDATDFEIWDEKWCNGLVSLLSAIAFCWHIIEI